MKRIALALAFIAFSSSADAVQVLLLSHHQTAGGGSISTRFTNGPTGPFGVIIPTGFAPPSTAVWDWDGTTLTGTGFFGSTAATGDAILRSIIADQIQDLSIDTSISTATATSYECVEGSFLGPLGANGCGGYTLGTNFTDDSTTIWSGTSVSQTLGGDDVSTAGPRTIAAYNFGLDGIVGVNGLTLGDQILIGNGIPLGTNVDGVGGEVMTFQVVPIPAAFWLFGSALGLIGWMKCKGG